MEDRREALADADREAANRPSWYQLRCLDRHESLLDTFTEHIIPRFEEHPSQEKLSEDNLSQSRVPEQSDATSADQPNSSALPSKAMWPSSTEAPGSRAVNAAPSPPVQPHPTSAVERVASAARSHRSASPASVSSHKPASFSKSPSPTQGPLVFTESDPPLQPWSGKVSPTGTQKPREPPPREDEPVPLMSVSQAMSHVLGDDADPSRPSSPGCPSSSSSAKGEPHK